MPDVIVSIGANDGNPVAQVQLAMDRLQSFAVGVLSRSSLWLSEPIGMNDQSGTFVNAVVAFETNLAAVSLLSALQALEVEMGRPANHKKNVGRELDLDLITYGDEEIASVELTVPHPRAVNRLFVLLPLAEVRPTFILPGRGATIDVLINEAPPMEINPLQQAPLLP